MIDSPPDTLVRTYRYLRLAMLLVLLLLAASVVVERTHAPGCWQTSISAYYYTPVRAVFVGALVTLGVCMVALQGNTRLEDVLLNVGGMVAPVVAVVPTQDVGLCSSAPLAGTRDDVLAAAVPGIDNNVLALLVVGVVGLVAVAVVAYLTRDERTWGRWEAGGLAAGAVLVVAAAAWYSADGGGFRAHAHTTAAGLLFVCIIAAVAANGYDLDAQRGTGFQRLRPNRYWLLAAAMVLTAVPLLVVTRVADWHHGTLVVETDLLAFFAVFWVMQSWELRTTGSRLRIS